MKWLLNSAVLPAGEYGIYNFQEATWEELREFLADGEYISRIGYLQTAHLIARQTGLPAPFVSREHSALAPGDVAMVVRLRYRVEPGAKGAPVSEDPDDWEVAVLRRADPWRGPT